MKQDMAKLQGENQRLKAELERLKRENVILANKLPNNALFGFSLREKSVGRRGEYQKWYAYKRIQKRLYWVYLGDNCEGAADKIKAYLAKMELPAAKASDSPQEVFDFAKASDQKEVVKKAYGEVLQSFKKCAKLAENIYHLLPFPESVKGENPLPSIEKSINQIEEQCKKLEEML